MRSMLISAALAAGAFALPAAADDAPRDAVKVSYSDLNLASPQGRAELNARVDEAIAQVCRRRFHAPMENLGACRAALRKHIVDDSRGDVRSALVNRNAATANASRSSD